jgi:hypothetical protein
MKGIIQNRDIKTMQKTIYNVKFIPILTQNNETQTLTNRNKRKIQAIVMTLFRCTEGK